MVNSSNFCRGQYGVKALESKRFERSISRKALNELDCMLNLMQQRRHLLAAANGQDGGALIVLAKGCA